MVRMPCVGVYLSLLLMRSHSMQAESFILGTSWILHAVLSWGYHIHGFRLCFCILLICTAAIEERFSSGSTCAQQLLVFKFLLS